MSVLLSTFKKCTRLLHPYGLVSDQVLSFIVFIKIFSVSDRNSIFNPFFFLYDFIYLYLFEEISLMPSRYCIVVSSVCVFVTAYACMYVYDCVDVRSSMIFNTVGYICINVWLCESTRCTSHFGVFLWHNLKDDWKCSMKTRAHHPGKPLTSTFKVLITLSLLFIFV